MSSTTGASLLVKICTIQVSPWLLLGRDPLDGSMVISAGPVKHVLDDLSKRFNFRYEVMIPPDNTWGKKNAEGNWSGMIGVIQRLDADMIAMPILPVGERTEVLDFTVPIFISHMALLAGGGGGGTDDQGLQLFRIFFAFDMEVKVGILVSIVILVWISALAEYSVFQVLDPRVSRKRILYRFTFYYLAILFGEATAKQPRSQISRFLMSLWLLTAMLILNGFNGIFKSVLTVVPEESRIDSIEDLARKRDIAVMTLKGTSYETMFKNPSQESFRRISQLMEGDGYATIREMHRPKNLVRVKTGQLVLVSEAMSLKSELHKWCLRTSWNEKETDARQQGNIYFGKEPILPHYFTMGFRKGFFHDRLRADIDQRLNWIIEADLMSHWLNGMFIGLDKCLDGGTVGDRHRGLGLQSGLAPVFLLWTIGLVLASAAFVTELLLLKSRSQRNDRTTG